MSVNLIRSSAIAIWVAGAFLLPDVVGAHLRDFVFPVYELPSSALPDVHDGTLADWEAVLTPSVKHSDFIARHLGESETHVPVPPDEATIHVYLAWHQATQRVFVALRLVTPTHTPHIPELIAATTDIEGGVSGGGHQPYDRVDVYVDGDHSGGVLHVSFFDPIDSRKDTNNVQAQKYLLVAEAAGPRTITADSFFPDWALAPPFADGGGFRQSGVPSRSGYELYLTPWDELRPDLASSRRTRLEPGATIGFEVAVWDYDETFDWDAWWGAMDVGPPFPDPSFGYYNVAGMHWPSADFFVDGLLVPCDVEDCSVSPASAVRADSWGRIKASFR